MVDDKTIRAFLATDLPDEILREIAGVQSSLKRSLRGDIRWVRPEGIHLTLKFFGNVSEADVRAISDIVVRQVASVAPMSFQLGELGAFPDYQHPRVIWVGLMGDIGPLAVLQKRLEQQFQTIGFPEEGRPFRAHLTLARVKTAKGPIGLAQSVDAIRTTGRFEIGDLSLYSSRLSPQGAFYTKLATFVFRG